MRMLTALRIVIVLAALAPRSHAAENGQGASARTATRPAAGGASAGPWDEADKRPPALPDRMPRVAGADSGREIQRKQQPPQTAKPAEARRPYQISLGPWSVQFSVPESVDLLDLVDRARGFFGMLAILGVAVFLSENRRAIS